MKQRKYWLIGMIIGLVLAIIQIALYFLCLPTQQGPYGFCGIVFALPFGIVLDPILWQMPSQLRIPIIIIVEIIVVVCIFTIIGLVVRKIKNNHVV
jgi:hypothetical protein